MNLFLFMRNFKFRHILIFLSFFLFISQANTSQANDIIKGFQIPLVGSGSKQQIISAINRIAGNFNLLIIIVNNKVQYDTYPEISSREGDSYFPVRYYDRPMPKSDLKDIVEYAKSKGFEVVPEVNFFSHQEKLFRKTHPELMFNEVTYDSMKSDTYKIVYAIIDELIEIFKPKYFHIGHDEVREFFISNSDNKSNIPSYRDFAADINMISNYLQQKNISTMIYGDMLLHPDHFDIDEYYKKWLHGDTHNYYKAIDLLDKNIIIVDWHYWWGSDKFPTVDYFTSKGFRVLGSAWKDKETTNSFINYICNTNNSKVLGMIITAGHHFAWRESIVVEKIISNSIEAFSNCN